MFLVQTFYLILHITFSCNAYISHSLIERCHNMYGERKLRSTCASAQKTRCSHDAHTHQTFSINRASVTPIMLKNRTCCFAFSDRRTPNKYFLASNFVSLLLFRLLTETEEDEITDYRLYAGSYCMFALEYIVSLLWCSWNELIINLIHA